MKTFTFMAVFIIASITFFAGILAGRLFEYANKLTERETAGSLITIIGEIATKNQELYELGEQKSQALIDGASCAIDGDTGCYLDKLQESSAIEGRQSALFDEVNNLIDQLNSMVGDLNVQEI